MVLAEVAIIFILIHGSVGVSLSPYGSLARTFQEVAACDSSPCQNAGSCTNDQDPSGNLTGLYLCHCRNGFSGRNCEIAPQRDACDGNPCENGGLCNADRTPDGTYLSTHTCHCFYGYTGDRCETAPVRWQEPVTCDSAPCKNGSCLSLTQDYLCECLPGFAGQNCERVIKACASDPCWNYATCVDDAYEAGRRTEAFTCQCPNGYSGKYCEHGDDLKPAETSACDSEIYCNSRGACIKYSSDENWGDTQCMCNPGYTGPRCEFDIQDPGLGLSLHACDSEIYCNNRGTCTEHSSDEVDNQCQCNPGYTGPHCEFYGSMGDDLKPAETSACDSEIFCNSRGACINYSSDENGGDNQCLCIPGYTGPRCEFDMGDDLKPAETSACDSEIFCNSRGACIKYSSDENWGDNQCQCNPGYTGSRCEFDMGGPTTVFQDEGKPAETNECDCNNRGTCTKNYGDDYVVDTCQCNPGYTGPRCEFDMANYQISSCCVSLDKERSTYGTMLRGGCRVELPSAVYDPWLCQWYMKGLNGSREVFYGEVSGARNSSQSGTPLVSYVCSFSTYRNDEDYAGVTFEMSISPASLSVTNIFLSEVCYIECGENFFTCDQVKCREVLRACDFFKDCDDGRDESFQTCRWWCVIDHTGFTCKVLATIPFVILLLVGMQILLCEFRPSKTRGRFVERRLRSDVAADKFDIVRLWFKSFVYYSACCCCRIFVPSRQRGQFLEAREVPNDPADDKFTAAGRFAKRNCLEIAGLWVKSLLYYCACCCCRIFVPSRQRGRLFEEQEVPTDTTDKFEAAGRFVKKNCLETVGLWLQCVVYYICCCCCFWKGKKEAAHQESPYSVLVPDDGSNPEKGNKPPIAPVSMDMARPKPATIPGGSELSAQLLQYVENV